MLSTMLPFMYWLQCQLEWNRFYSNKKMLMLFLLDKMSRIYNPKSFIWLDIDFVISFIWLCECHGSKFFFALSKITARQRLSYKLTVRSYPFLQQLLSFYENERKGEELKTLSYQRKGTDYAN